MYSFGLNANQYYVHKTFLENCWSYSRKFSPSLFDFMKNYIFQNKNVNEDSFLGSALSGLCYAAKKEHI